MAQQCWAQQRTGYSARTHSSGHIIFTPHYLPRNPTFAAVAMKRLVTLILFFCLSCQLVLKLSIVAWFEINQEYIAATMCENKSRPELVCCGKCILTKQLAKADAAEKKEKGNTPVKVDKTASVVFILPEISGPTQKSFTTSSIQHPGSRTLFADGIATAIFHPPNKLYS